MEQKFRIKNTISGIVMPLFVCLFVCWECGGGVSVKRLFRTFKASAFKTSSPTARAYNTVARQVPGSIASVVKQSSL